MTCKKPKRNPVGHTVFFRKKRRDARLYRTVQRTGTKWTVKFDMDGGELPFDSDNLLYEQTNTPLQVVPIEGKLI